MIRLAFAAAFLLVLGAPLPPASAAPTETSGSLDSTLRDLLDRLRGRKSGPQAPVDDATLGRIVSWNVQTLGKKASKAKKDGLRADLARALIGAGPAVFAAQEVANDEGAAILARQLPGGGRDWETSFEDTENAQDNALFTSRGVRVDCAATLRLEGVNHPPRMAHVTVDDADFTILSVHLTYAKGDAGASAAELERILDWVRAEQAKPGADQDFVVAGDFNLPSRRGRELSARARDEAWRPLEETVGSGFTVLVDEATSRSGREKSANNYDHFIVSRHFEDTLLVVAGAVDESDIVMAERATGKRASDHFPIALTFRRKGPGRDGRPVSLDGPSVCR